MTLILEAVSKAVGGQVHIHPTDLALQRPSSLDEDVMFAHATHENSTTMSLYGYGLA